MKYGPNSEQVEAYLRQVAEVTVADWATLAQELKDQTSPLGAALQAIETGRTRARKNGVLSEVDAAAREAHQAIDATLTEPVRDAGVAAFSAAATAAASLLVLRPLLTEHEFSRAWPMRMIDPHSLPQHVYVPPIGAAG